MYLRYFECVSVSIMLYDIKISLLYTDNHIRGFVEPDNRLVAGMYPITSLTTFNLSSVFSL